MPVPLPYIYTPTSCFLSFSLFCVKQVTIRSTIQFLGISIFTLLALTIIIHTMIPSIPSLLLNQDALFFLFEYKVVVLSLLWCATIALIAHLSTRPLPAQFRHTILEAEEGKGMFSIVASLLAKTTVEASRITLLIIFCSMFAPSLSFSSFIVHRFKLAPSLKTFNLAGMGCSTGTIFIDLATKILRRQDPPPPPSRLRSHSHH